LDLENNVKEKTGIKTLKIGFNRVFGYYIEVTRSHLLKVPDSFERRQSLVNSERFVTAELKELEAKILSARDRVSIIEKNLFKSICTEVNSYADAILHSANLIANIDVICSYANVAMRSGWIKPKVNTSFDIKIKAGRHPTVESNLGSTQFVPNDVDISHIGKRINIITGPNMSGKSTYIRQIGILCMLAQSGSFVPAESATIGLVDRIFTRAGLGDDISEGKSTFMIEMIETAEILNNATDSSLAIMDEVGRGTSTYDGLAIARAVVEYIHNSKRPGFRTLFATHFHEMADLSNYMADVYNLKVAVSEDSDGITFLRTILPGGSDKSYGVHVAKLAGMPDEVINRSWDLLRELENDINPTVHPLQMEMDLDNETYMKSKELADYLLSADLDLMTPIEALNVLNTLKSKLDSGDLNDS
jgi:DNA mismatch repair protein MutS